MADVDVFRDDDVTTRAGVMTGACVLSGDFGFALFALLPLPLERRRCAGAGNAGASVTSAVGA